MPSKPSSSTNPSTQINNSQLLPNDLHLNRWRHHNDLLPPFLPYRHDRHLRPRHRARRPPNQRHPQPGNAEQHRPPRSPRRRSRSSSSSSRCTSSGSSRRLVLVAIREPGRAHEICAYAETSRDEDHCEDEHAVSNQCVYNLQGAIAAAKAEDYADGVEYL